MPFWHKLSRQTTPSLSLDRVKLRNSRDNFSLMVPRSGIQEGQKGLSVFGCSRAYIWAYDASFNLVVNTLLPCLLIFFFNFFIIFHLFARVKCCWNSEESDNELNAKGGQLHLTCQ